MTNANDSINNSEQGPQDGITKREYFAAMAMQGLLANNVYHNPNEKHKMVTVGFLSEAATIYADALITALNQTK